MHISKEVLDELGKLNINGVSTKVFCPDDIFLHKGKFQGLYIIGIGVVLEPVYAGIMRLEDILKVGVWQDKFIMYGGYLLSTRNWVIPPMYTDNQFWEEFRKYKVITYRPPD